MLRLAAFVDGHAKICCSEVYSEYFGHTIVELNNNLYLFPFFPFLNFFIYFFIRTPQHFLHLAIFLRKFHMF